MGALKTFPVSVVVAGRRVVVAGGGEAAAAKLRLLAKTGAAVHLFAAGEEGLAAEEAWRHGYSVHHRLPESGDLRGTALAFIATDDEELDRAVADRARAAGVTVNVVDRPELCDVLVPAFVDRAPVTIAISTEGAAPVLAGMLRSRIETLLTPGLGALATLAGGLREGVAELLPPGPRRLAFWRAYFGGEEMADAVMRGPAEARRWAMRLLEQARAGRRGPGMVWLVGIGPGAADLLTIRAHRVLAEADVVIHDEHIAAGILEHVRRDARRIVAGAASDKEVAVLTAEARRGQRVVRLMTGDAASDPTTGHLIAGLCKAGVAWALVPGFAGAPAVSSELEQDVAA